MYFKHQKLKYLAPLAHKWSYHTSHNWTANINASVQVTVIAGPVCITLCTVWQFIPTYSRGGKEEKSSFPAQMCFLSSLLIEIMETWINIWPALALKSYLNGPISEI